MRIPSIRELRARVSHGADVVRLIANKEYILITKKGVYIHADWRGMNAEVQIHAVEVMQNYLDDVLRQLHEEDPVATEARERIKQDTAMVRVMDKAKTVSKQAVRKIKVKKG